MTWLHFRLREREFSLRRAGPSDATGIVEIEQQGAGESGVGFALRQVRRLITNPRAGSWVAVSGTAGDPGQDAHDPAAPAVAGWACVLYRRAGAGVSARLYSVGVHAACRGAGLGRTLVVRVLEDARSKHARAVSLEVREGNTPALRLYESLGFTWTEVVPDYYTPGVHGVRMRLALR